MFNRFVISYTSKVASISGKFIAIKNVGDLYFQPLLNVPGSSGLFNTTVYNVLKGLKYVFVALKKTLFTTLSCRAVAILRAINTLCAQITNQN